MTPSTLVDENTPEPITPGCRIQLTGLKCIEMEGWMWPDAIYLKISYNGESIEWPQSRIQMSSGDFEDLRFMDPFTIEGPMTFQLWDDDANDPDDDLGTGTISCSDAGFGEKYLSFTQDGANYRLYYIVR